MDLELFQCIYSSKSKIMLGEERFHTLDSSEILHYLLGTM